MGDGRDGWRPSDFFAPAPTAAATLPEPLPAAPPPPVRAQSARPWVLVAAVAVFVVVAALLRVEAMRHGGTLTWGDPAGATTTQAFGGAPPVHETSSPQRLLPAVPAAQTGGYTFDASYDGTPVRWDPCRPIHYVVSGAEPFTGANQMLAQALAEAGAASGLKLVSDGPSTEPALPNRASYQPERYGRTWAPVLIAWTDQGAVPELAGNVIGLGGGAAASVHGSPRLVSGIVYFDAPELSLIAVRGNGYASMRTVMLHEIGHLLGLGHVSDASEVMYPSNGGQGDYGPGDRAGLAVAGSAPCSRWS